MMIIFFDLAKAESLENLYHQLKLVAIYVRIKALQIIFHLFLKLIFAVFFIADDVMRYFLNLKIFRFLPGIFICLVLAAPVKTQFRFDSWTTDNGLPQNGVRGIAQTPDGYLWFTTF